MCVHVSVTLRHLLFLYLTVGEGKTRLVPGTSDWPYPFRAESTWPIPLEPRVEGNESQMTQVLEATATRGT